jgi:hypothetical protein
MTQEISLPQKDNQKFITYIIVKNFEISNRTMVRLKPIRNECPLPFKNLYKFLPKDPKSGVEIYNKI